MVLLISLIFCREEDSKGAQTRVVWTNERRHFISTTSLSLLPPSPSPPPLSLPPLSLSLPLFLLVIPLFIFFLIRGSDFCSQFPGMKILYLRLNDKQDNSINHELPLICITPLRPPLKNSTLKTDLKTLQGNLIIQLSLSFSL